MRNFTLALMLMTSIGLMSQESTKVTMKLTYKGAPLCYWDVTLKHGDAVLKQAKTDDKGFVDFGYVRLLSYGVDASGYKKTDNGEKKWDVKGYITLNEQGHADFDFLPLVEETGMGGMMEAAWGLTLNDCGSGSSSASSSASTSSSTTTGTSATSSTTTATQEPEEPSLIDQQKASQEQWQADWESGKTTAEGYQNQRTLYINKIDDLNRKITKKTEERDAAKPGTKYHSDLGYDIKDMELERSITELKLERINKEIANNNTMLGKTERDYYKEQEDALKAEQKALKDKQNSGVKISENQSGSANEEGTPLEQETSGSEETLEKYVLYSVEEIAAMNTLNLQKLKLEYQTKAAKRKTVLKTTVLEEEKRARLEKEVFELESVIGLLETELEKRKDK